MAFEHGSGAAFSLDDSGGTLRDISAYVTSVDGFPLEVATHDVTTLSKSSVVRLAGLKDTTATIAGVFDATIDGYFGAAPGVTLSYEFGPQGGTSGDIKYSGEAICKSYKISNPVSGPVTFTIALEGTGDITRGTY